MHDIALDINKIDPSVFRSYDIRGIVDETLTEETVYWVGRVIGSMVQEQEGKQIVVGRDGRLSSPGLSQILIDGVLASGCDVIDLGCIPTPFLYYSAFHLTHFSGIMLTGSHNPPNYNGMKMVVNGHTISEQGILQIYQRIIKQDVKQGQGCLLTHNCTEQYLAEVVQTVVLAKPLKIVVDAGNGVAGAFAPKLFRQMGCEVHELYCDVDGRFPHHEADPSREENLQELIAKVAEISADVGLAFDGDGDRLGVVTNKGEIIWPDRLLMLFAASLLEKKPDSKIIFDVKCTSHLEHLIASLGGEPLMWKTGHSLIKAKMSETQAVLAGEMSGHFFFKDRWYGFDDALYAGARLLEILSQVAFSSHELFAQIPNSVNTPEIKIPVDEAEKFAVMDALKLSSLLSDKNVSTIDGMRIQFEKGWGLIRPSNTTPYLILRFEAANESMLNQIQLFFRQWIQEIKPDWALPF